MSRRFVQGVHRPCWYIRAFVFDAATPGCGPHGIQGIFVTHAAVPARQRLRGVAGALSAAVAVLTSAAHAQAVSPQPAGAGDWNGPLRAPLQLQGTAQLQEQVPPEQASRRPVHLSGQSIEGSQSGPVRVRGNARLRRADALIQADELHYDQASQTATASGQVQIEADSGSYRGSALQLNVQTYQGHFDDVRYQLRENRAHGQARRVDFLDRERYVVHEGDYTTCQRSEYDPDWRPAWRIRARELRLDRVADVGVARGAALEFMGVPVLPVPYLSFPLSDRRKSGLLPPTLGLDSVSGLQYTQPFYWNIAPNRDATLSPTLMARRGIDLGGQFRYLERSFSGELAARYMPSDRLRDRDRWSMAARHRHTLHSPLGDIQLGAQLNRVSDNDYWRDFPRSGYGLNERLLPSELNANWQRGDWQLRLRALKWQTLQDADAIILPPYDMLPQLNLRYQPWALGHGLDLHVEFDSTRFRADRDFAAQLTDGQRSYALARLSRPWVAPQGFITPAVQLHASQYRFDAPLPGGLRRHSRVLPTYSLDAGLVFERELRWLGRDLLQTLEPRAFYTYTPYRDQSMLPMYDTAELDFTFASIYAPNSFVGHDRIADDNVLTLGLSSRFLGAGDGAELARLSIAQRLRFEDQRVTAPGVAPYTARWSDILLGGAVNWSPRWASSGIIQYNLDERRTARYTLTGHYKPGDYRVLSMGYRMKADASKHAELGWQWPLAWWGDVPGQGGRWYSVGRLNYSMRDKKLVDTVVGVEYNGCCWIGRVVVERLQNSARNANTRLLLQLELAGISRINIGSNPLNSLRNHVPYYQEIRPQSLPPASRFSEYGQ
ncbi:LPS biosynthesis protein [Vandammella animalimorsus]|uniref:LPS-assembly protein LptD n=1 Tax=Vandammella animalimorsus TaxID=2029117 RepID=A0A2A2T7K9_9BURK|nr:LPS biosynthesis protein [Vandammella animalimorsus]PAX17837.1 LPS biosynthesis protein [Vandammella animalimorsus]PAX19991.1 LPS biosynthesis protein [Vandammella animalimorsus]